MSSSTFRYTGHSSSILYRLVDIAIIVAVFLLVMLFYGVKLDSRYALVLTAHLIAFSYIAEALQLYRSWRVGRFVSMLKLVVIVQTIAFLLLLACIFVLKQADVFSRFVLLGWFLSGTVILLLWRCLAKSIKALYRKRGLAMQKVAIIGCTESGLKLYEEINRLAELGFECVGIFDDRTLDRLPPQAAKLLIGNTEDAVKLAASGDLIKLYICLPILAEKRIAEIITALGDSTVDVLMVPDFLMKNLMHGRIGSVGDIDTISVFESPSYGIHNFYKRTFDIAFSFFVLLLISPLLLGIAIAIKITSPGPVFFKQDRYGLDGRRIGVLKFRSMRVQENGDKVIQATKNDSRITPLGAFLRRTSLDELPQFINVLLGEMSVVGPRPHAVAHNEQYRKQVSFYMLRHKVKPGITGLAQINGWRGETDTLEKMEMRIKYDLEYIRNWSMLLDISIIFKTLFKGFVHKNAY